MIKLEPKYKVELVVKGRSRHYAVEISTPEASVFYNFKSVTQALGVINKPALLPWARRVVVEKVREELMTKMKDKEKARVTLTTEWIDEMLAAAKKRPDVIRDEAAELGTEAHGYIDLITKGKTLPVLKEEIRPAVEAFKAWWEASRIEIVLGDTPVVSLKYEYGGKLDALGWRAGKYIILDYKTGGIYVESALQASAYGQAASETFGITIDDAAVVGFSKKPPVAFQYQELSDLSLSFSSFLNAKALNESLKLPHFLGF